ncbi:MAG TPA: hypothetical protein PLV45_09580, partial [bacterium]|nr:hypothetical protein [bacterium]
LIQDDCTPDNLVTETRQWMDHPGLLADNRRRLADLDRLFGETGASDRAAQVLCQVLNRNRSQHGASRQ